MTECEDIYKNDKLPNNCTVDAPIRCSSTNNCIAFGKSCPRVNKCSNNATNPFLC